MPKVYSPQKREEIRNEMLEIGLELIKKNGMKKMSIEEITKTVKIAQGTFYHFFASKEVFVVEIAKAYQRKINRQIETIVKVKGGIDREDLRLFYRRTFLEDQDSVFRYLRREDIQTLIQRLPEGSFQQLESSRDVMERMLRKVIGRDETCDLDLVYNWIQLLNITVENKDMLAAVAFERTFDGVLDQLLNEIFKEKEVESHEIQNIR